jgi:hypothetical protein
MRGGHVSQDSLLSDDFLRSLMAVGHVDVFVGVPTLDNASTIGDLVEAAQQALAQFFPRDRTLLMTSDGGSTDGTLAIARDVSPTRAGTAHTPQNLRTTHRINAPSHGVPGQGRALRQILAAADLTQARTVAILSADVAGVTSEGIAALIQPVKEQRFDYVVPVYARHPLERPLVTQLIRPLLRAAYGRRVQEPLAGEFGCSSRLLSHYLEQETWGGETSRHAVDLWMTGAALSGDFTVGQTPLGSHRVAPGHNPGFQETFQQVVGAAFACLEYQAAQWLDRHGSEPVPLVAPSAAEPVVAPSVDGTHLTDTFRVDLQSLQAVLEPILDGVTLSALHQAAATGGTHVHYPDALWASTVYEFFDAHRRSVMRQDHITQALMPLYLGRTGSFLIEHAASDTATADAALESLCLQFEQLKPSLIERWNRTSQR